MEAPLTTAQAEIYLHQKRHGRLPLYNIGGYVELNTAVDFDRFSHAARIAFRKYDALRLRITGTAESARQYDSGAAVDLEQLDFSGHRDPERAALDHLTALFDEPYVLEDRSLVRHGLLRLGNHRTWYFNRAHHLLTDGWGYTNWVRFLVRTYESLMLGEPDGIDASPVSFLEHARAETGRHSSRDWTAAREHWSMKWADMPEPALEPRGGAGAAGARSGRITLEFPRLEAIKAYCLRHQVGVQQYFLGLLHLYATATSGQDVSIIGTVSHNRRTPAAKRLVGALLSRRPMLIKGVNGEFAELLREIGRQQRRDYRYSDYPLIEMQWDLQRAGKLRPHLFEYQFNYQKLDYDLTLFGEPTATHFLAHHYEQTPVGLTICDYGSRQQATLLLDHNLAYLDESRARRLLDRLLSLNEQILAGEIDARRPRVACESDVDQYRKLNDTDRDFPSDPVPALIAARAQATPEALALSDARSSYTYEQLEKAATRLAVRLRALGVRQGECVGIYLQRHCEMVIALLAVWKAGAAYVPLDPEFPLARLKMMVEDSGCAVILSEPDFARHWQALPARAVDLLGLLVADAQSANDECTSAAPSAEAPAYVLFTSGSTGRPKGVVVAHGAVSNFMHSMSRRLSIERADVLLALTTLSFDISILELFLPLVCGARVVVANASTRLQPRRILELVERNRVTVMQTTPSLWRLLLDQPWRHSWPVKMLCGGEALPRHLAARLLRKAGELWNLYGPTEATIWSSAFNVVDAERPISLGAPLDNVRYYVLDSHDRLCPPGVAGELGIAGRGLAQGYCRRPDLTREKFVEIAPLGALERVYKTGDRVVLEPDGSLVYLGRQDNQVKLRGLRIELDEIACALESHPGVKQAAVTIRSREGQPHREYLCAHYEAERPLPPRDLRRHLAGTLSEYMVPSAFVWVDEIPKTDNGKRDLKRLPEPDESAFAADAFEAARTDIERSIASLFERLLERGPVSVTANFFDLGATSVDIINAAEKLHAVVGHEVDPLLLFEHPTVRALAKALAGQAIPSVERKSTVRGEPVPRDSAIAIIGMAGFFPGAPDVGQFWEKLMKGETLTRRFTPEELSRARIAREKFESEGYVPVKGVLPNVYGFDHAFFGYTARDAALMDPQMRLFHEVVWHGIEDAGLANTYESRRCGLFAGAGVNHFWVSAWLPQMDSSFAENYDINTLNSRDFLCTRVAYALNLKGPAVTVQTACSTSLMAVHLAAQSLRERDCDIAIAGGVAVHAGASHETAETGGYLYQEGMILSPEGVCRPFDARANGTVASDGAGVVVLKRIADAIADGDQILAVIRGSAANNDGRHKIGFTAPSVSGQANALAQAVERAGISVSDISYVETHGTGTALGDPIEINALGAVYGEHRQAPLHLGALKGNIGHLDAAAGIAGLIKTVLVLRNGQIPPACALAEVNPKLKLDERQFVLSPTAVPLPARPEPHIAAVSAFGIGGTNVHMIVQGHPIKGMLPEARREADARPRILPLSAKSPAALEAARRNLADWIEKPRAAGDASLADLAFTLGHKRRHFVHRCALVCDDMGRAAQEWRNPQSPAIVAGQAEGDEREVVFLFPGQGAQTIHMGRELYESDPAFRDDIDRYLAYAQRYTDTDLRRLWLTGGESSDVTATAVAQPLLFIFELALARLLMSWGIEPAAMLGHSVGEYVAACLAGVFSEEDGVRLIIARGRLMQAAEPGAMLSVALTRDEVAPYLTERVSLAAVNSSGISVLAGSSADMSALQATLRSRGIEYRELKTSHAFHTPMMEAAARSFVELLAGMRLMPPTKRFFSNVSGTWITAEEATSADYWGRHLRQPVMFEPALAELLRDPQRILLEVGPGRALCTFARRHRRFTQRTAAIELIPPLSPGSSERQMLLTGIARAYVCGLDLDWSALNGPGRIVRLPLYAFERTSFPPPAIDRSAHAAGARAGRLLFKPRWSAECVTLAPWPEQARPCLLFAAGGPMDEPLIALLRSRGIALAVARHGERFETLENGEFRLDMHNEHHFALLVAELVQRNLLPGRVIHLGATAERANVDELVSLSYFSVLRLLNALAGYQGDETLDVVLVAEQSQLVLGNERIAPARATGMGALRVAGQERPSIRCRLIDVFSSSAPAQKRTQYCEQLAGEIMNPCGAQIVALRWPQRWTRSFAPVEAPSADTSQPFKDGGVYLITGGLGGVGLHLARSLATRQRLTLVLSGRTLLPERARWREHLDTQPEMLRSSRHIRALLELESLGCTVDYVAADVTRAEDVAALVERVIERHGAINGVIHAAGAPGGRAIWRFDANVSRRVMAPKIHGTEILLDTLDAVRPDFVYLMSSVTALVGGFGQADYCAANAYLDAVAHCAISSRAYPVYSINWDTWENTGMAQEARRLEIPDISHAGIDRLLGRLVRYEDGLYHFSADVAPEAHWVFSEHWVLGRPTVAGATYFELARQALLALGKRGPCELERVEFLQPLSASYGETLSVQTELREEGGAYAFGVFSQASGGSERIPHATGKIRLLNVSRAPSVRLSDWLQRAYRTEYTDPAALAALIEARGEAAGQSLIEFGPRWRNVRWIKADDAEGIAVACLALPDACAADLAIHALHPALLDCATGFLRLTRDEGEYLPASYGKLTQYRPLPARLFSLASRIREDQADGAIAADLTLVDEDGAVLVAIEDFVLRAMKPGDFARRRASRAAEESAARGRLSVAHALKGFAQLVGLAEPQIVVTETDIEQRIAQADAELADAGAKPDGTQRMPRPNLSTPFVPARTREEKILERLWTSLLGLESVGVHDDFFELGGHSLLLAQLHQRLKKEFETDLAVAELYNRKTISQIAARLAGRTGEAGTLARVDERAKKQRLARERRRREPAERIRSS